MLCTASAIVFWFIMALYAVGHAITGKNYSHETWEAKNALDKVGEFGCAAVFLIDLAWAVSFLFLLLAGPAWSEVPFYDKAWVWLTTNITLPWIAPQVLIMIGFVIYFAVLGQKPTPKA